jgi:transcription initiation factor TFIID TATA-box-binding protein
MSSRPEVVNVVATGELEGTVHLERLYQAAKSKTSSVRYDPAHHQGCYLRFFEDGPLITVYASGKYIIRAGSVESVHDQRNNLLNHLSKLGVPDTVCEVDFDINNVVGSADLNREVALDALHDDLENGNAVYSHDRIDYSLQQNNCTITIFRTGSVTILGASSTSTLYDAWDILIRELDALFKT